MFDQRSVFRPGSTTFVSSTEAMEQPPAADLASGVRLMGEQMRGLIIKRWKHSHRDIRYKNNV